MNATDTRDSDHLYALLGEVDEDRAVLPSEEVMERLRPLFQRLNDELGGALFAPLVLGEGFPEFSSVLLTPAPVYRITRAVTEICRPLAVRIVLARGGITGGLESRDPEAMEGPAYDLAGELLYRARKEDRMLLVETGDGTFDALFNALTLMLHRTFRRWTPRQWDAVRLYRDMGRQSEVAERLGVSQQSVSNTLAGAGWRTVQEVEEALERALERAPAAADPVARSG